MIFSSNRNRNRLHGPCNRPMSATYWLHHGMTTYRLHHGMTTYRLHHGMTTYRLHHGMTTYWYCYFPLIRGYFCHVGAPWFMFLLGRTRYIIITALIYPSA